MIFLQAIPIGDANASINLDVIFFLIGMFSIVSGLAASGLLSYFRLLLFRLIAWAICRNSHERYNVGNPQN